MSRLLRLAMGFASFGLLLFFAVQVCAQDGSGPVNATGCLKQGNESGGYYLVAQDGKIYELVGKPGELSHHVNHTVSITGEQIKLPASQERKIEPSEKTEAGSSTYSDFRVSQVKMVSADCSK